MHRFERWRDIIQRAGDIAAVRRALREYVDTIGEASIGTLPPDCQRALRDDDIQSAAVTLVHRELGFSGDPAITGLLHEIAQTYAAAATRITRLNREPLTPSAE